MWTIVPGEPEVLEVEKMRWNFESAKLPSSGLGAALALALEEQETKRASPQRSYAFGTLLQKKSAARKQQDRMQHCAEL